MNPIDILKAKEVNVILTIEGLEFTVDGKKTVVNYEAMSITEALLLRLAFAREQVGVRPGTDTSEIFKTLEEPNVTEESK